MSDFNPSDYFIKLKGQDYLEAKFRIVWFRLDHPDGQIVTDIVSHDIEGRSVIFRAKVTVPSTGACATGYCEGDHGSFKHGYLEKAETQAIGRALAFLGYGTAQAAELDMEEGDKLADTPVAANHKEKVSDNAGARAAIAAEIIGKVGYRPSFSQWQQLARTHGADVPVSPDTLTVSILTTIRDSLAVASIQ